MDAPLPLVEGWTGPIDMQLTMDGVAGNMTGTTVALVLRDNAGALVTLGGVSSWVDAVLAKARYAPVAADLLMSKSPYTARWKVTDATSKDVFFPNADSDVWIVRK
jgi:hypothetical protein